MYGVMIAVGILAAFSVLTFYGQKIKLSEKLNDFIFFNGIATIAVGFGCAALFQAVYDYIENPRAGFKIGGSITFLGGLIGGTAFFLIVYFILRNRLKIRITHALSLIPCMITIGHAFGRIGCFFGGCCYGKITDSVFGVLFPGHIYKVHPTQLYEAIFLFVLFAVCSYLLLKKGFQHNLSVYFVAYGIFRFLIEFLRGDARGELITGISPSQFWSLCMVAVGIIIYFPLQPIFEKQKAEKAAKEQEAQERNEEPAQEQSEE